MRVKFPVIFRGLFFVDRGGLVIVISTTSDYPPQIRRQAISEVNLTNLQGN